jgi:glycosyltransferase involved in cell wall biosynthesis
VSRVHQVLSGAGPYDAVSGQALGWRALLERWGMAGGVYADAIDPRVRGVQALGGLDPGPDDLVVLRYSAFAPRLRPLLELPQRKLLVYHNVTPARYFWRHHAGLAVACALGRAQLPRYTRVARVATADSRFNAHELEAAAGLPPGEVRVVPILLDRARLDRRAASPPAGEGPLVIAVGRLVPNKRHDLVLAAFAAYQRACAPEARLLCVGEPLSSSYRRLVERLAEESGATRVTVAGGLSQAELNAVYASAAVLLSLSEHEGFSVPLLEAFHFGVPVVARPVGGMPEVGGDAVLWTAPPRDGADAEPVDVGVVAELLDLAVRDAELRGELARRGRARLEEYSYERTADKVRAAIEAALE